MPRTGRLHIPGGYYHVIGRGLERRTIFQSVVDKRDFLARFGEGINRTKFQCLAWALMSNHYHFLIKVNEIPLSKLMASVLGGFASSYNRRRDRCGYVFQNRYKSILVDADSYLLELVRYIHLNPVRAGMVAGVNELGRYAWTGHAGMLNKQRQNWHSVDVTLAHFGKTKMQAKTAYLKFLQNEVADSKTSELSGGGLIRSHGGWQAVEQLRKEHVACIGDERILGSSQFVESVLKQDDLTVERRLRLAQEGWDIEKLVRWVCKSTGVGQDQLLSKARCGNLSEAKAMLCYLATNELELSLREMASYLLITQPAVSAWVKKGELLCRSNGISLVSIGG